MRFNGIHHVAIICSDYARSKKFYVEALGLKVIREIFRKERESYKLDLEVGGGTQIELFSFPNPTDRISRQEACGLRHLAFSVADIAATIAELQVKRVAVEPVRVDALTGKAFTFFSDPDGLPLEFYEG